MEDALWWWLWLCHVQWCKAADVMQEHEKRGLEMVEYVVEVEAVHS